MTSQELLLDAAEGLEANDWCQGCNFIDVDGRRWMLDFLDEPKPEPVAACAVGAICLVGRDYLEERGQAMHLVEVYLAAGNHDVRPCVSAWNDKKGRTKAEVVAALRGAAGL